MCNSQSANGLCTIKQQIYAVNFFGGNHTDSRSIFYQAESSQKYQWALPSGHINKQSSPLPVAGVPKQDKELYNGYFSSVYHDIINTNHGPRDYCHYLLFETAGDGLYEISLKVGEMHWNKNIRMFSILLNDIYIVQEFLVQSYRDSPNGFELITNFKIFQNNTMIKRQGHPSEKLKLNDRRLRYEICYSYCYKRGYRKVDPNWITTAMSIVKFAV